MVILNKCSLPPSRCGQIHSHLSPWILTFQRFHKRKKWLGILGSVAYKAKYRSVKKQTTLKNNSQLMDQVTLGMVQVIANAESQMLKWYMGSLLVPGWKARTKSQTLQLWSAASTATALLIETSICSQIQWEDLLYPALKLLIQLEPHPFPKIGFNLTPLIKSMTKIF